MFYTIAVCLASNYCGFYTYMFVQLMPKAIKDIKNNDKIKYKQL